MTRRSIPIRIRGQEFKIRSDADEETLHRVAALLDEAMERVEQRTGAVDSFDVAVLTALNLAREVMELRAAQAAFRAGGPDPERLRDLIDLAESAL